MQTLNSLIFQKMAPPLMSCVFFKRMYVNIDWDMTQAGIVRFESTPIKS